MSMEAKLNSSDYALSDQKPWSFYLAGENETCKRIVSESTAREYTLLITEFLDV